MRVCAHVCVHTLLHLPHQAVPGWCLVLVYILMHTPAVMANTTTTARTVKAVMAAIITMSVSLVVGELIVEEGKSVLGVGTGDIPVVSGSVLVVGGGSMLAVGGRT